MGDHTLPCLLAGRSRTMGFCCFSLKGLRRVILLSTMGKKTGQIGPVLKIVMETFTSLLLICFLTVFNVTWFYWSESFFKYPRVAQSKHFVPLRGHIPATHDQWSEMLDTLLLLAWFSALSVWIELHYNLWCKEINVVSLNDALCLHEQCQIMCLEGWLAKSCR